MSQLPIRKGGFQNFIGAGISHRLQPLPATGAVIPPLPLYASFVGFGVGVIAPRIVRRAWRRTLLYFPAKTEFIHAAVAAMRAINQKRHTFLIPANGIPQIADASS